MEIRRFSICKSDMLKWNLRSHLLFYLAGILLGILSIGEAIYGFLPFAAGITVYVAAACAIAVSVYLLAHDIKTGLKKTVHLVINQNALTNRIYSDRRYRIVLATAFALILNLLYAAGNGILALLNRSSWMGTLAAYYIFLSIMRFIVIRQERREGKEAAIPDMHRRIRTEWNVCRYAGILLTAITIVLIGAVILLVKSQGGKSYPGYLIFAVAAYTFYKVIIAVINIGKVRKLNSPLLFAVRCIGYADALVSVLSLQTAMFTAFGEGEKMNIPMMNGITGAVVCVMILIIGIYMIIVSGKQKNMEL